jgi:protein-disulfide isomerase
VPPDPTASTSGPTSGEGDDTPERSRRLLLGIAVLGAVSAVIAGVVIFSSGGSTTRTEDPEAQLRASGEALIVGSPDAAPKVVVFEDFGDRQSREFEIASRDFLQVEAAQGNVLVEYRPFHLADGYSQRALQAWAAVLEGGTAKQAMAFHDELFDHQPDAGAAAPAASKLEAWAVDAGVDKGMVREALEHPSSDFVEAARRAARASGVESTPTVLVDGKPSGPGTGVELADQLQRRILAD